MASERYDILAEAPENTSRGDLSLMLQALLADRFKLVIRREVRESTVYALVVAKNGLKLKRSEPGAQYTMRAGREGMSAVKMPLHMLADLLSGYAQRIVVDKTGVEGDYDFKFDWSPRDPDAPSLFTAVQEQLGLKLESEKAAVEFLIIEHAERPTEN